MLETLTFSLRDKFWGRVRLRKAPPRLAAPDRREQAFYERVLERAGFWPSTSPDVVFDVGCRNWSYAPALAAAFPNARLVGIEVDGGRRYWNLYRRIDLARAEAARLEAAGRQAECLHADLRAVDLKAQLRGHSHAAFCFFYPFVSERPCRKWGLPPRFADFGQLLMHVREATRECRLSLVSCHQGEWEAEPARAAYAKAGLAPKEKLLKFPEFERYWPAPYDVHLFSI